MFTVPKDTPTGDYLIRIEHIALHVAQSEGGAQLYVLSFLLVYSQHAF